MRRYYFDVRDGDHVTLDEEGMELISIEAAWGKPLFRLPISQWMQSQCPAQTCLAVTSIEVRDDSGPVLVVAVTFV
jgi:hypothetical protein